MQRASTLENSTFNVVLLKYLWRTTAVLGHSKSICLTIKWHLQWSQTGWLSLDRRYEWVIRLWPILSRVMTVSSRRHNDVRGLFLPSTGLIENSLLVGVLSHESCSSSIHSLDICGKKLSGGILLWVMTEQIPSLAALSAILFPYIPTWHGIQYRLTCLPISVSWVKSLSMLKTVILIISKLWTACSAERESVSAMQEQTELCAVCCFYGLNQHYSSSQQFVFQAEQSVWVSTQ